MKRDGFGILWFGQTFIWEVKFFKNSNHKSSRLHQMRALRHSTLELKNKVMFPKYAKHWLFTVAHTIDCVCCKILNHSLNHGLSFSLFKATKHSKSTWKFRIKIYIPIYLIFQFYLMYRLICQKPANFMPSQMALVSTFFQMFKVLGMYNFALEALCFLGQLQAPENLYDATLYFGGNANRRSRTQHTTGTVRNSASARWRQSNRSRTQYCVRSRCPNETL